jgi:hypothetical protein
MPLAKSSTPSSVIAKPIENITTTGQPENYVFDGVPIDCYRYFSIDLGSQSDKELKKIKDIYEWSKSKCDEPTIGNIVEKISKLEKQLGAPRIGEKSWDKVWQWVKLSRNIDDLDKQRETLRRTWL